MPRLQLKVSLWVCLLFGRQAITEWILRIVVHRFFNLFSHLHKILNQSNPYDWHNILCKNFSVKSRQSIILCNINYWWSKWSRGLRRGSTVVRLLGLRVWIPTGAWKFFSCECCVLWGRGLCVELITRSEIPTECGVSLSMFVESHRTGLSPLERSNHKKKFFFYKIAARQIFTDEGDRRFRATQGKSYRCRMDRRLWMPDQVWKHP
jgi:hypothetical protein